MKLANQIAWSTASRSSPSSGLTLRITTGAEVSGTTVLDADMTTQTIRLGDLPGAGHLPIARFTLDEQIHARRRSA